MINEEILELTSGARSYAEEVHYKYSEVERNHKYRFLFDPLRILKNNETLFGFISGSNNFPLSVEIDPSNVCNHDCPFCIYSSLHQQGRKEFFTKAKLLEIIQQLIGLKVQSLLFIGGGEPLANKATSEAIQLAFENGISVGLVTNGSLLNHHDINKLKQACTYIRISLDASNESVHKTMHNASDFKNIINNIKQLVQANGNATLGISFFVNDFNVNDIYNAVILAKQLGVHYIQIKTYAGIPFSAEIHNIVLHEIEKIIPLSDIDFDVHVSEKIFTNSYHQVRGYTKCHWQNFKAIINADGNLYVCAQKRNVKNAIIGNVHDATLIEIWESDLRKKIVDDIILKQCPYCVHHSQNVLLDFLLNNEFKHNKFI